MFKEWIDGIVSSKKLPDYEFSPFPKPPLRIDLVDDSDEKHVEEHNENHAEKYGGNGAEKTEIMTLAVTFLPVVICMTFF